MAPTKESIDICGVLVHAQKNTEQEVKEALDAMEGVEVHHVTDDSRLIVVIDLQDKSKMMDTIGSFNNIPNVLSAVLTYQHSEEV